jgi:hypothetical protein
MTGFCFATEQSVGKPDGQALLDAVKAGSVKQLEKALDQGATLEAEDKRTGRTALIVAAALGRANMVERLLVAGAEVNARDKNGWTALMVASEKGHTDVVKKLLLWGAEIGLTNKNGTTALMLAAFKGQGKTVDLLLKAGANLTAKDNRGWTAARWARFAQNPRLAKRLEPASADTSAASPRKAGHEEKELLKGTVTGVDRPEGCLRVRSGPGTDYRKIECLAHGERVDLTGKLSGDKKWAQIEQPVAGWVYAAQIKAPGLKKEKKRRRARKPRRKPSTATTELPAWSEEKKDEGYPYDLYPNMTVTPVRPGPPTPGPPPPTPMIPVPGPPPRLPGQ